MARPPTKREYPPFGDLQEDATEAAPRQAETPSRFTIVVVRVVDAGKTFEVEPHAEGPTLVGTSPSADMVLSDKQVSRRHAALEVDGELLRVRDLDSTNGTWLLGTRVVEALLRGGERILIGDTELVVTRGDARSHALTDETEFGSTIGASAEMRRRFPLLRRIAGSTVPVIIEGETGTGKEVLAESIHAESARRDKPFVVFDCTAVPPSLVESELFGHEKGAFTGAVSARRGVFEQAHGGTLLIDEIGDLDLSLQPKLLRAIQRSEFRRVGGDKWIKVDVRILVATRRDLDREVQAGRFRDDLFHRLAVARVELPPLRRRRSDIPFLVRRFCDELAGDYRKIPAALMESWLAMPWPGNVRELRNAVARHVALGELASLDLDAVPESSRDAGPSTDSIETLLRQNAGFVETRDALIRLFERRYIQYVLDRAGGNVGEAAAHAGVARRYFQLLKAKQNKAE